MQKSLKVLLKLYQGYCINMILGPYMQVNLGCSIVLHKNSNSNMQLGFFASLLQRTVIFEQQDCNMILLL